MHRFISLLTIVFTFFAFSHKSFSAADTPFSWKNATIYFVLTDRFENGDTTNDFPVNRKNDGAHLRSYEGGDLKGLTNKINEGYFSKLGVNAIWLTPHVEQIHGPTDEGTGRTYAYHGYWASDWTAVDPNLGTMDDMKAFVEAAHNKGIRVLLDVVINHTGPTTKTDPQWPNEWVRTSPRCQFKNYESTVKCTLVKNLPDIKTEANQDVELPPQLVAKWKKEGRYKNEKAELDAFFKHTGFPKAPRYYIMKWHLDWIRDFGVDGFRVDTAKHTEAQIWKELKDLAHHEFEAWKKKNPRKKISDEPFYMTAEVYGYGIQSGQEFVMGPEEKENFYKEGFDSLINFSLKGDANKPYEEFFSEYSALLNSGDLKNYSVVNYISSHDDHHPFDKLREKPFESANKLLLAPGAAQIYYGDESARLLESEGATGDAHLRTNMNWTAIEQNQKQRNYAIKDVLTHWQKLGQFRNNHVAIGAGIHSMLSESPYVFSRETTHKGKEDKVVIALELAKQDKHVLPVGDVFEDGTVLTDYYSGKSAKVKNGTISIPTPFNTVLLEK